MTKEFDRQAQILAAMFAMQGYIAQGMRDELIPEASYLMAKDLMAKFEEDQGIAALKPKAVKK